MLCRVTGCLLLAAVACQPTSARAPVPPQQIDAAPAPKVQAPTVEVRRPVACPALNIDVAHAAFEARYIASEYFLGRLEFVGSAPFDASLNDSEDKPVWCKRADEPRYVLNIPSDSVVKQLAHWVQLAATKHFVQPVLQSPKVRAEFSVQTQRYDWNALVGHSLPQTVGAVTVVATTLGRYEIRAREIGGGPSTDRPIGSVELDAYPVADDCGSETAKLLRQICAHPTDPCRRIALLGDKDAEALLSVLQYIETVAPGPLPFVELVDRKGLPNSEQPDRDFEKEYRWKRFYASLKPKEQETEVPRSESLALRRMDKYGPMPVQVAPAMELVRSIERELKQGHFVEVGRHEQCDDSWGKYSESLVLDSRGTIRMYAEVASDIESSGSFLRAYYDEGQRLRFAVSSQSDEHGNAWNSYLYFGSDGCLLTEKYVRKSGKSNPSDPYLGKPTLFSPHFDWDLDSLSQPRQMLAEPFCRYGINIERVLEQMDRAKP